MNDMRDKVVVITGASSGLGRATAEMMAAAGARVVLADIDRELGEQVAGEIDAVFTHVDVSDRESVDTLVGDAVTRFGRLDVMFNNAGVVDMMPITKTSDEAFSRMVAVNIGGSFYGTRAAARVMESQRSGVIINTASNGGSFPTENMAVYCGTKASVIAMSKSAAIELAPKGIRVNTISPGTMLTGMVPDVEGIVQVLDKLQPIGYAADPSEMAAGVMFLASDAAGYVAGHDLVIDGGATAGKTSSWVLTR